LSLFPLPLAHFEHLFRVAQGPLYPQDFVARADFEGRVDRDVLAEAFVLARARHPLLRARLEEGRTWVLPEQESPLPLTWVDSEPELLPEDRPAIDVCREDGFRVRMCETAAGFTVCVEANHACSDGVGICQFFADLFLAYRALLEGEAEPSWAPCDPSLLVDRGKLIHRLPIVNSDGSTSLRGRLRDAWRIYGRTGVELRGDGPWPVQGAVRSPVWWRTFAPETLPGLEREARRLEGTVNHLLLVALFGVLARWSRERHGLSPASVLKVAYPVDCRRRSDLRAPAMNKVGGACLNFPIAVCEDTERLAEELITETRIIKRFGLGALVQRLLDVVFRVPLVARLGLPVGLGNVTGSLTYVGDLNRVARFRSLSHAPVFQGPGYRILRVAASPALKAGTPCIGSVMTVAGRMTLGMVFDRRLFSAEAQQEFVDLLVDRIRAVSASPCGGE
jgi:hypothetical protein